MGLVVFVFLTWVGGAFALPADCVSASGARSGLGLRSSSGSAAALAGGSILDREENGLINPFKGFGTPRGATALSSPTSRKQGVKCPLPPGRGGPPGAEPAKDKGDIRALTKNVRMTDGSSKPFPFKYSVHDRGQKDKKTMVLIKGGPTVRSWIENTAKDEFKDYNLIVIELPGAGLNKFDKGVDFDKEVSVSATAELVKDIVAKEHLDNYVLGGHSYGTTIATAAAAKITNDKSATKPKGVLLMGTQGRATQQMATGHEVTEGPRLVSNAAYKRLSEDEKAKLKEVVAIAAKRPTEEMAVGNVAGAFLGPLSGNFENGVSYMKSMLAKNLSAEDIYACMSEGHGGHGGPEPDRAEIEYAQKFYSYAGCEQVSGKEAMDTSHFFEDVVISSRPNACHCSPSSNVGKYDSAKYQIQNVPLYYVTADDDFNTPHFQFDYHKKNQTHTNPKTVFEAKNGGHGLGFSQFGEGSCGGAVEGIFASSPSQFWKEMNSCAPAGSKGLKDTSPADGSEAVF